jgi:molybdate transport system substrate-binding protein
MAAASLTEAFSEIGQQFEAQNPGMQVDFSFAGSQQLSQQLANAAPADVFASANQKYMDSAVQSGRVAQADVQTFAKNRLVVIFPKANPAGLKSLADLRKQGLKLVLAAKEVPVGQYAQDFLDKAAADPGFSPSFKEDVLKNVVSYEDNVKSVLTKVALDEADAGIVYTSDVNGDAAAQVGEIPIPDALNVIATYPIAPIKGSPHAFQAQAFVDLVRSPAGQAILAKYGFIPASEP